MNILLTLTLCANVCIAKNNTHNFKPASTGIIAAVVTIGALYLMSGDNKSRLANDRNTVQPVAAAIGNRALTGMTPIDNPANHARLHQNDTTIGADALSHTMHVAELPTAGADQEVTHDETEVAAGKYVSTFPETFAEMQLKVVKENLEDKADESNDYQYNQSQSGAIHHNNLSFESLFDHFTEQAELSNDFTE